MSTNTIDQAISSGESVGQVVTVTPEHAERWLGRNVQNRNLRQSTVDVYARDMLAGNWMMTGEAVKFNRNGRLLDGQHRLAAVVQSGCSIPMLIVSGLADATQNVMDSGVKRTAADVLRIKGTPVAPAIASAARLGVLYDRGDFKVAARQSYPAVSHSEILAWLDLNPDAVDVGPQVMSNKAGRRYPGRSRAAGIFAWTVLRRIDRDQADDFFDDLLESRGLGLGDPRSALNQKLSITRNLSAPVEAHLLFRTWNAIRTGETLKMVKTPHPSTQFADPR